MANRNKRLEPAKPKQDTPAKAWKRKEPAADTYRGKFKPEKDLPKGNIAQHRAKPGMTSPQ
jgi:hypothetical protein